MRVYILRYADGRKPSEVSSLPNESPMKFLERLRDEFDAAEAIVRRHPRGRLPMAAYIRAFDRSRQPPLRGAMVADLLRQAREMGDASAITPDGRLMLRRIALSGRDLEGADFSGCDLSSADLSLCNMADAKFVACGLRRAKMHGVVADAADFRRSDMRRCSIGVEDPGRKWPVNSVRKALDGKQMPVLAGARFEGADLSGADIWQADLSRTRWSGAALRRASVESCDFTDADFGSLDAREAVFMRNRLHIRSIALLGSVKTASARFIANSYVAQPDLLPLVTSPRAALGNLRDLALGLIDETLEGSSEIRRDLRMSLYGMVLTGAAVAYGANVVGGPLALVGASVFSVTKGVRTGLAKASEFALAHLGGALEMIEVANGGLRSKLQASVTALTVLGRQASRIVEELRKRPDLEPVLKFEAKEGIFLLDTEDKIRGLLRHVYRNRKALYEGMLDSEGNLSEAVGIIREVGGHHPEERAPRAVRLFPDGRCTAFWTDAAGRPVMAVAYDPDGNAVSFRDATRRRIGAREVADPAFLERRAAFEELKEAVVRCAARHDAATHEAVLGSNVTIVIRDRRTGKVDNPHGPAVIRPDGEGIAARQGIRGGPAWPRPMAAAIRP